MFMSICVLSRYAKKKRYTRTEEDDCLGDYRICNDVVLPGFFSILLTSER